MPACSPARAASAGILRVVLEFSPHTLPPASYAPRHRSAVRTRPTTAVRSPGRRLAACRSDRGAPAPAPVCPRVCPSDVERDARAPRQAGRPRRPPSAIAAAAVRSAADAGAGCRASPMSTEDRADPSPDPGSTRSDSPGPWQDTARQSSRARSAHRGRARQAVPGSASTIAAIVCIAVVALEGPPAGNHFVDDRAEGELVGAEIDRPG